MCITSCFICCIHTCCLHLSCCSCAWTLQPCVHQLARAHPAFAHALHAAAHVMPTVFASGGGRLTIVHIFGWRTMSFHSFKGLLAILSNLVNAALGAIFLLWIVSQHGGAC